MKYPNLAEMMSIQAQNWGNKPLVYLDESILTYSDVEEMSNKGARVLQNLGIKKGDRIGILMENTPLFFPSLFSILKAGAVVIPINNMLKDSEIAYILNDCEAKAVFTTDKYADIASRLTANIKTVANVITWGKVGFPSFDIVEASQEVSGERFDYGIYQENIAFFVYTSGTTGHPKGAMLTHGNMLSDSKSIDDYFKWSASNKFLLFLPMFHSYTLMTSVLYPVYLGCSIVMLESVMDLKTKKFRNILIFKRPKLMVGVPQIFQALIKAPMPKWFIRFFYPIKVHISGGAPISEETLVAFKEKFGVPILEGYGLSEASPVVSFNTFEEHRAGTVGKPLPGIKAKIVDAEDSEVPVGQVGELIVKGGNIMKGYWHMPKATDDVLKNGWLFTGDFARMDSDGFISIVDRKKDLIIAKGMNVYPREIEDIVKEIPEVEAVAVIGVAVDGKDEIILAYVKITEGSTITANTIKKYLKPKIANFKMPKNVYIIDELPLTATGKVLKRKLKEMVSKGEIKI